MNCQCGAYINPRWERCQVCQKVLVSYHGYSLDNLKEKADDDWDDIKDNQETLMAFAHALRTVSEIQQGTVPNFYSKISHCSNCGDIPLWSCAPNQVKGCPWCLSSKKPIVKNNKLSIGS